MNVLLTSRPEVVFCNYIESAVRRHPLPWHEEQNATEGRVIVARDSAIVVVCDPDTDTKAVIAFAELCVRDGAEVTEPSPPSNLLENCFSHNPTTA